MAFFQGPKPLPRSRQRRRLLVVAGLLVAVFLLGRATWHIYQKNALAYQHRSAAEEELVALVERNNHIEANINKLETPAGIEAELREAFPVVRAGEQVVVIVDRDPDDSASSSDEMAGGVLVSFWQKMWPW